MTASRDRDDAGEHPGPLDLTPLGQDVRVHIAFRMDNGRNSDGAADVIHDMTVTSRYLQEHLTPSLKERHDTFSQHQGIAWC